MKGENNKVKILINIHSKYSRLANNRKLTSRRLLKSTTVDYYNFAHWTGGCLRSTILNLHEAGMINSGLPTIILTMDEQSNFPDKDH